MRGDSGSLYDAHATRLYAYCWSLVGEDAPAAVRDTFVAAMQHPPRGDAVLWLYALARPVCMERGALDNAFGRTLRTRDPLLRAAASLRADHREVLLLAAGEWLDVPDIARVLGIAPDTVRQLLHTARTRLEGSVLDTLIRDPGSQYDPEVIAAFEKGALPRLLARRVPHRPPPQLKPDVLTACAAELDRPMSTMAPSSPLVVIGDAARTKEARRKAKGRTAVAGLAASVAAAVGLLAAWTSAKSGGDNVQALSPSSGQGTGASSSGGSPDNGPDQTSSNPVGPSGSGSPSTTTDPDDGAAPGDPADPGAPPPSARTSPPGPGPGAPPPDDPPTPKGPGPTTTPAPPTPPPPTSPGPTDPPTDPPTETPTDPGTPSPEPTDPPEQSPNPSTNPSPSPSDTP